MWKLDFFILPSRNYKGIDVDEAYEFGERIEYLEKKERVYIPEEFYNILDQKNITAFDFLYGSEQNDLSDYLLEIISKQKTCHDTYAELNGRTEYGYLPISEKDISAEALTISVVNIKDVKNDKSVQVNDIIRIKRFYLGKTDNYKIFENRVKDCFPDIVFHNDAFKYIEKLGKCADVVEELIRHLTVLNDVGKRTYSYYNKNEKEVLAEFKAGYNIECSGKGSNEEKSYNKDIVYNDKKFQLTCNPHTKLYKKRTDQRIYFCWGRDEIENHNIIVVRMGDHWQE